MENQQIISDIEAYYKVMKRFEEETLEENKRIDFLNKHKLKKEEDIEHFSDKLNQLKENVSTLERDLHDQEALLERGHTALSQAQNENEHKLATEQVFKSQQEKDLIESKILELFDEDEALSKKIDEAHEFIKGINENIEEANKDLEAIKEKNNKEIEKTISLITGLLEELDSETRRILEHSQSKHGLYNATAKLNNNNCSVCRMTLTMDIVTDIKNGKMKQCQGCQRLIIN